MVRAIEILYGGLGYIIMKKLIEITDKYDCPYFHRTYPTYSGCVLSKRKCKEDECPLPDVPNAIREEKTMNIVDALGGKKWFQVYAILHLFCLMMIAGSLYFQLW